MQGDKGSGSKDKGAVLDEPRGVPRDKDGAQEDKWSGTNDKAVSRDEPPRFSVEQVCLSRRSNDSPGETSALRRRPRSARGEGASSVKQRELDARACPVWPSRLAAPTSMWGRGPILPEIARSAGGGGHGGRLRSEREATPRNTVVDNRPTCAATLRSSPPPGLFGRRCLATRRAMQPTSYYVLWRVLRSAAAAARRSRPHRRPRPGRPPMAAYG